MGLLSDIHEDVSSLRWALDTLRRERVDQFVCLGDVSEDGSAIAETCALLAEVRAVGVWGNHGFGLCTAPLDWLGDRFPPEALFYIRSYRARLSIDDCHFSHIEPCLDASSPLDLWQQPVAPDSMERLARNWNAVRERRLFMGHLHRWFAASSEGVIDWWGRGRCPPRDAIATS